MIKTMAFTHRPLARPGVTMTAVSATAGLGLFLGVVSVTGILAPVALVVLLGFGVIMAIDEPKSVLVLILGLIFIDRSPVMIHQSYIRLYQVCSLPIILKWMILRVHRHERPYFPNGWGWALLWIVTFFFAWPVIISRTQFFIELLGSSYLLLLQIVTVDVIVRYRLFAQAVNFLTYSAIMVTVSGIIQYVLVPVHIFPMNTYGGFVRPYGLMREPDWYGVVAGMTVLLTIHRRLLFSRAHYRIILGLAMFGLLASLSRASWLAFAVGVLILATRPGPDRHEVRMLLKTGGIAAMVGLAAMAALDPNLLIKLLGRLTPLSTGAAAVSHILAVQAWASRLGSLRLMWALLRQHPWFGNGAGVMGRLTLQSAIDRLYAGGGSLNTGRAATNVFLSQAASVGIVGVIPFTVWFLKGVFQGMHRRATGPILGAVLSICLIDFQFNSGTGFGFFWVLMGLALIPDRALNPNPADTDGHRALTPASNGQVLYGE